MTTMNTPSHPGEIVRECLEGTNLNVTEGAAALGVTRATLSRLLNARAGVSPEMAVRLSKAFGLAQIEKGASKIRVRRVAIPKELALQ